MTPSITIGMYSFILKLWMTPRYLYLQVILKVDSVTLTVFMSTGTLMIQGNLVLDWFLNHFQSIMDHYDAPVQDPQPRSEAFKQYTESWKKLEDEYNIKRGIHNYNFLQMCYVAGHLNLT